MTFFPNRPKSGRADLAPVADVVSPKVWRAMVDGSALLAQLGIKHAVVGGLAVGAHGWPRATKDVDFLVDDTAWQRTPSGLVVLKAGLPVEAHGVAIDTLSIRDGEEYLRRALDSPEISEGIPVAPIEPLVYLKLRSPRSRDRQDVVELIRNGIDIARVRLYLTEHAADLVTKLDEAARLAEEE